MKTRALSAIIIAAIGFTCIIVGGWILSALVFFIAVAGLYEFYRAFEQKGFHPVKWAGYGYAVLLLLQIVSGSDTIAEIFFPRCAAIASVNWYPPLQLLILLCLLTVSVLDNANHNAADNAVTLLGGFYVVFLSGYFISVRQLKGGVWLFCLTLIACVAADTFAFLIGSKFGKRKLIPSVSPNKTVAGSVAAFAGTALLMTALGLVATLTGVFTGLPIWHYPILGFVIGGLAQIGDLTASATKRYTGVKDFGTLIPGHGGILDRVDSYLFVFPIVYYYLTFIGIGR